jgi:hypothetical protein
LIPEGWYDNLFSVEEHASQVDAGEDRILSGAASFSKGIDNARVLWKLDHARGFHRANNVNHHGCCCWRGCVFFDGPLWACYDDAGGGCRGSKDVGTHGDDNDERHQTEGSTEGYAPAIAGVS